DELPGTPFNGSRRLRGGGSSYAREHESSNERRRKVLEFKEGWRIILRECVLLLKLLRSWVCISGTGGLVRLLVATSQV
ncbi:MAG: hypothetical protein ACTS4W_01185, partial [Candidatus Hodgkinia cicadicola]